MLCVDLICLAKGQTLRALERDLICMVGLICNYKGTTRHGNGNRFMHPASHIGMCLFLYHDCLKLLYPPGFFA